MSVSNSCYFPNFHSYYSFSSNVHVMHLMLALQSVLVLLEL
jgi:hypothetical protein